MKPLTDRQKELAWAVLVDGPLRVLARPIFRGTLTLQKAWFAATAGPPRPLRRGDVTAVIKTFQRPERCRALIASIRRLYPDLPIIVVDDSHHPADYPGCQVITLPFNSGLSAGRNAGVAAVATDYTLLLDDDLLFERRTDLGGAVAVMDEHRSIDLLSGIVLDLPVPIIHDFRTAAICPTDAVPVVAPGTRIGPAEVMDKLPNFFVGRTSALRQIGWDPQLKLAEHADFFTRAKGVLVSAEWNGWRILHCRDPFNRGYLKFRNHFPESLAHLRRKYALDDRTAGPQPRGQ